MWQISQALLRMFHHTRPTTMITAPLYLLQSKFLFDCTQRVTFYIIINKFVQSNFGRGPRRGAIAHVRPKGPIGYNGAAQNSPPKVPLPVVRSPNPTTLLIPGPVRPMMPNGIRIRFAVFPQCSGQSDRPTDRSRELKFDDYRPLRYDSDAA